MTPRSVALAVLASVCWPGCVDPFADKTTTPDKYSDRSPHRAAANAAGNKGDSKDGSTGQPGSPEEQEEPAQTYQQAWQLICQAEQHAAVPPGATRADRGAAVASWIVGNVTNKKARYWFIDFGNAKQESKPALFLAEVARVGIDPCPLAGLLFGDDAAARQEAAAADDGDSADAGP